MIPQRPVVVVAAYNEAKVIRSVVAELVAAGWRVVVVDDGSRDDTSLQAEMPGATVVTHCINLGQGAALQTGIDYALSSGADAIVTFDADGQHEVADIPRLLEALATHDVALGSRFLGTDPVGTTRSRTMLLRAAVRVSNVVSRVQFTDAHCGLRAFRAEVMPQLRLKQDRMAHASELLSNIRAAKLTVKEVPVTVRYTDYSRSKGQSGIAAIRILFDHFMRP